MYYIDVDGGIDVTLGYQQSCCGTGHAKELYYTFGVTRNQVRLNKNSSVFNKNHRFWAYIRRISGQQGDYF